jgi:predicted TPR repeat methyltransferase
VTELKIEYLLVALRDEAPPERAPDRTIPCIYRDFADHYDTLMRDDLNDDGPQRIMNVVKPVIGELHGTMNLLTLGCGSGFSGMAFKPCAAHLIGLDLARERNVYDELQVAEITEWLEQSKDGFDLIISCDCLISCGELHRIVAAMGARLKPGGHLGMSMERGDRYPFRLTDTGRYAHHEDHLRDTAAAAGLKVAGLNEVFLRKEYGVPAMGLYGVLEKPKA